MTAIGAGYAFTAATRNVSRRLNSASRSALGAPIAASAFPVLPIRVGADATHHAARQTRGDGEGFLELRVATRRCGLRGIGGLRVPHGGRRARRNRARPGAPGGGDVCAGGCRGDAAFVHHRIAVPWRRSPRSTMRPSSRSCRSIRPVSTGPCSRSIPIAPCAGPGAGRPVRSSCRVRGAAPPGEGPQERSSAIWLALVAAAARSRCS
jgi:hypothetical protein